MVHGQLVRTQRPSLTGPATASTAACAEVDPPSSPKKARMTSLNSGKSAPVKFRTGPRMPFDSSANRALVAPVRARQPSGVSFESAGPGSTSHLAMELLMSMADFRMLHVPYRGGAPAIQALIAGEVQIGFSDAVIALPFVGSDKIRMLAVSTTERLASAPELPTIAESGVAGFQSSTEDVALFARSLAFALLADGVPPDKLYPMDIKRAFMKLDQIK